MHINRDRIQNAGLVFIILGLLVALVTGAVFAGGELTAVSITPDIITAEVGDIITWTALPTGGEGDVQYFFELNFYLDGSSQVIPLAVRDWGVDNTYSFVPASPGNYEARVYAKDGEGTQATRLSEAVLVFSDDQLPYRITAVTADKTSALVGEVATWTVEAAGGVEPYQYAFAVYRNNTLFVPANLDALAYGGAKTYTYEFLSAGNYRVRAYVKDDSDVTISMFSESLPVSIAPIPEPDPEPEPVALSIVSITPDSWVRTLGFPIRWQVYVEGGTPPYDYRYEVYRRTGSGDGAKIAQQSYRTDVSSYTFDPEDTGEYRLRVFVMDAEGVDDDDSVERYSLWVEVTPVEPFWWNLF